MENNKSALGMILEEKDKSDKQTVSMEDMIMEYLICNRDKVEYLIENIDNIRELIDKKESQEYLSPTSTTDESNDNNHDMEEYSVSLEGMNTDHLEIVGKDHRDLVILNKIILLYKNKPQLDFKIIFKLTGDYYYRNSCLTFVKNNISV